MVHLTPNSIKALHAKVPDLKPVVQVIDIKPIQNNTSVRYRLIISDGVHYCQAMLATQLNEEVTSNRLKNNCIIQVKDFLTNEVQNRFIVILLQLDILDSSCDERIGKPTNVEAAGEGSNAPQRAPMQNVTSAMNQQPPQPVRQVAPPVKKEDGYNINRVTPVVREDPNTRIYPIAALNPYIWERVSIKARVTAKSDMRHYSNQRGEGKLFSVDLLDEQGGEIRATMFNQAADKFYPTLQVGRVFIFTFEGKRLKMANKQYTSIKNDYEVTLDERTDIVPVTDDGSISTMQFSFKKINILEQVEPNSTVDVIGIVREGGVGELQEIVSKAGKQLTKRDLVLADDSGSEVRLTLWGEKAKMDPSTWANNAVVAVRNAKVSDFNGRTLGTYSTSQMLVNPDIPEAAELANWFNTGGAQMRVKSISTSGGGGASAVPLTERKTIVSIKEEHLGMGEKPDYITLKATISAIKRDTGQGETWYYPACPTCNKKVVQDVNGNVTCERCNKTYDRAENRYILNFQASDHTGRTWFTAFNDQGIILLGGRTANELAELQQTNEAGYASVFNEASLQTWIMKARVKAEQVQDDMRVKCSVVSLTPVDYVKESSELISAIEAYS